MELYVLDSLFRSIEVVEKYVSFIWTERFNSAGDFELLVESTPSNRSAFTPGMRFALSDSVRCMETETVEDATDEEGRKLLKITGPSIELKRLKSTLAPKKPPGVPCRSFL